MGVRILRIVPQSGAAVLNRSLDIPDLAFAFAQTEVRDVLLLFPDVTQSGRSELTRLTGTFSQQRACASEEYVIELTERARIEVTAAEVFDVLAFRFFPICH